ncbi:hypothetical protein ACMYYO_00835 [Dermacoccaceae bacterium W4C1]
MSATVVASLTVVALAGCSSESETSTSSSAAAGTTAAASSSAAASSTAAATTSATPSPSGTRVDGAQIPTLMKQVRAAVTKAKTARVVVGGQISAGQTVQMDVRGRVDGSNQLLTMTQSGDSAKAELLTVGGKRYLKASSAFWVSYQIEAAKAAQLSKTYVIAPESLIVNMKEITINALWTNMRTGLSLDSASASNSTLDKITVNGAEAFRLKRADTKATVVFDAKTKLPIEVDQAGDANAKFSTWNGIKAYTAPAASELGTLPTSAATGSGAATGSSAG